jgi:hypothetical protein
MVSIVHSNHSSIIIHQFMSQSEHDIPVAAAKPCSPLISSFETELDMSSTGSHSDDDDDDDNDSESVSSFFDDAESFDKNLKIVEQQLGDCKLIAKKPSTTAATQQRQAPVREIHFHRQAFCISKPPIRRTIVVASSLASSSSSSNSRWSSASIKDESPFSPIRHLSGHARRHHQHHHHHTRPYDDDVAVSGNRRCIMDVSQF